MREIIADCVVCERPVEKDTPWSYCSIDEECENDIVCCYCIRENSADELLEKDIILIE